MKSQTFNILYVSKTSSRSPHCGEFCPSLAPKATLHTVYEKVMGIKIAKTMVQYGWGEYKLLGVGKEPSSCAVVLVVETNDPIYDRLVLYTDKRHHGGGGVAGGREDNSDSGP